MFKVLCAGSSGAAAVNHEENENWAEIRAVCGPGDISLWINSLMGVARCLNKSNLYFKEHWIIYAWKARVSGYDLYCKAGGIQGYRTLKLGEQRMWNNRREISRVIETGRRIVLSNKNATNSSQSLLHRTRVRDGFVEVSAGWLWNIAHENCGADTREFWGEGTSRTPSRKCFRQHGPTWPLEMLQQPFTCHGGKSPLTGCWREELVIGFLQSWARCPYNSAK